MRPFVTKFWPTRLRFRGWISDLARAELTFYIQTRRGSDQSGSPGRNDGANDVLTLLENDPEASRYFYAYNLGSSTGDGAIHQFGETWTEYGTKMIGSAGNVSAGLDTNPLETEGIFSSLIPTSRRAGRRGSRQDTTRDGNAF